MQPSRPGMIARPRIAPAVARKCGQAHRRCACLAAAAHEIRAPAEIADRRQPYFLPVGFLVVEVGLAELVLGLPPVAGLELPFQGSMGMGLLQNDASDDRRRVDRGNLHPSGNFFLTMTSARRLRDSACPVFGRRRAQAFAARAVRKASLAWNRAVAAA